MKMDFNEFKQNAMGQAAASEVATEAVEEAGEEITREVVQNNPNMSVEMGPEGTNVAIDAPIEDMSFQEAVEFAQSMQGPDLSEQVLELIQNPQIQSALSKLWYGPKDQGQTQNNQVETVQSEVTNPMSELETQEETATDGGELSEENIYRITPEGFVAILESQLQQYVNMKPDMTLKSALGMIEDNREMVVENVGDLLEELDE